MFDLGRQIKKVKVVAWLVTPATLATLAFHSWKSSPKPT